MHGLSLGGSFGCVGFRKVVEIEGLRMTFDDVGKWIGRISLKLVKYRQEIGLIHTK